MGNRGTYSLYVKAVSLHILDVYDKKNSERFLFYVFVFDVS